MISNLDPNTPDTPAPCEDKKPEPENQPKNIELIFKLSCDTKKAAIHIKDNPVLPAKMTSQLCRLVGNCLHATASSIEQNIDPDLVLEFPIQIKDLTQLKNMDDLPVPFDFPEKD